MPNAALKVGDSVRVLKVPPAVEQQMPQDIRQLFQRCVGQVLRIEDIDEHGHLEFWITDEGLQAPDCTKHSIWIEPEFVMRVN